METLSNYFQTNLQSFREAIFGTFCSQTLPSTANPQTVPTDAFQQDWKYQFMCPFPPFLKVQRDKTNMIIVTPSWQSQSWYQILFKYYYQKSNSLIKSSKSITQSRRGNSSSNSEHVTETGGVASIRQSYLQWEYQKGLLTLPQMPEEQVLKQSTNRPGKSGLAGVI